MDYPKKRKQEKYTAVLTHRESPRSCWNVEAGRKWNKLPSEAKHENGPKTPTKKHPSNCPNYDFHASRRVDWTSSLPLALRLTGISWMNRCDKWRPEHERLFTTWFQAGGRQTASRREESLYPHAVASAAADRSMCSSAGVPQQWFWGPRGVNMLPPYKNCISTGHLSFEKTVVVKEGRWLDMSVFKAGTTVIPCQLRHCVK